MDVDLHDRRWDTGTVEHGVADGGAYTPGVQRLLDALQQPDWIAEDPEMHLLPHPQQACKGKDSGWALVSTEFIEGASGWRRQHGNLAQLRADI